MNIFAVVCHGNAKGLLGATVQYRAQCSCLYNEPVDPNTFRNAPFLVQINEKIKPWFAELTDPWGLYLMTEKRVSFNEMRQHLRKFTYVKIPSQEVPVMFRFYDPRVFWDFTEVIDDWNLHAMLGPIEIVASHYGELKQDHFEERRKKYPKNTKMRGMFLTLTQTQEDALNGIATNSFQLKLYNHLFGIYQKSVIDQGYSDISEKELEVTLDRLAKSVLDFCVDEEIKDSRSIKMFSDILIKHRIYQFQNIPSVWLNKIRVNAEGEIGEYRMRMLINYIYNV